MNHINNLVAVADAYTEEAGIKPETTSSRVFGDSKKLMSLKSGGDITVTRWGNAMQWFSDHWPSDAQWPDGINRPVSLEKSA